jgi:hypothetical protein
MVFRGLDFIAGVGSFVLQGMNHPKRQASPPRSRRPNQQAVMMQKCSVTIVIVWRNGAKIRLWCINATLKIAFVHPLGQFYPLVWA